jgi:hypothetical protein
MGGEAVSAPLKSVTHFPTLPLREGRQNSSRKRSEREGFFGEGSWRGLGASRTPPRNASRFDPPSRGGLEIRQERVQNSSCFVRSETLYSQYEHKSSHACPAPRDPRGDGARAAETAGKARLQGEGGGGKRKRESNYVAEARRSPRQSQWREARAAHAGDARASRGDQDRCAQAASALCAGHDVAQERSISRREHGVVDRRCANATRLGGCVSFHRGAA